MAFTPEDATAVLLGHERALTSLKHQNNRLNLIVAALLIHLPATTQTQVLQHLQTVEPEMPAEAAAAQHDAVGFAAAVLSSCEA